MVFKGVFRRGELWFGLANGLGLVRIGSVKIGWVRSGFVRPTGAVFVRLATVGFSGVAHGWVRTTGREGKGVALSG